MKNFFTDFKKFITKGNVVDLAVAVVVGGAFGKIVTSLVNDIIMPLISLIVGGASVKDWKWVIKPKIKDAVTGAVTQAESALHYGNFIQTILDFLIIAFFIFLTLRVLMSAQKKLGMLSDGFSGSSAKEKREYKKQLKAQGLSKEQVKVAIAEKAAKDLADLKLKKEQDEMVKKAEEAYAAANKPEVLLKEIRDLLAEQVKNNPKERS